ncbi:chemocyanin-like [Hibiscus syriacus]|uniref:chemocyanin-like n=1 Tax=Hibiscus syriacus TaxID=106335 RepID=UPI001922FB78|nr:chemocyanin-like [Hibiscus syriacus]
MAQERGSAIMCMTVMLCMMVCFKTSFATTFMVGDASGWGFGVNNWPNGKSFKAGDVLAYEACKVPLSAPAFKTGDDLITLNKGDNYFLCGFPGHCEAGMKIAVRAT